MTKKTTRKTASTKASKRPPAKKKAVKRAAPAHKKTTAPRRPAAKKKPAKKRIGFIVECKKSKAGAWQKLCSVTSKSNATMLARAYWNANPTHWVRVID